MQFQGIYDFKIPLHLVPRTSSVDEIIGQGYRKTTVTVRVWAAVGDAFGWQVQHGWAMARMVTPQAKLSFLGDQPVIFRPDMPCTLHVSVFVNFCRLKRV